MTHTESDSLRKTSKGTKIPFKDLLRIWRRRQELSQSVIGRRFGVSHAAVSDWEAGKSDLPNRVIQELYWDFYKILIEPIQEPALVDVSKALGLTDKPEENVIIDPFKTKPTPQFEEEPDGMTDDERSETLKGEKERNDDKTLHSKQDVKEENPPLPDEIEIADDAATGALRMDGNVKPENHIITLAEKYNALLRFIKANR